MWQCGSAAMVEGAPCVAARRQSLRVFLRRPATHGRASYIAALPHYRITALLRPPRLMTNERRSFLIHHQLVHHAVTDGEIVFLVAHRKAKAYRVIVVIDFAEDDLLKTSAKLFTGVVGFNPIETAYHQAFQFGEFAGTLQGSHHPVYTVQVFSHFFQE
jgi:hypothetical protein